MYKQPSLQCDLPGSVHQLIGNHSAPGVGGGAAIAVNVSQFPHLVSGCIFYLSAPASACAAVRAGKWGEETELFLDRVTQHVHAHEEVPHSHQDEPHSHEGEEEGHHSEEEEARDHAEEEAGHQEEHVDVHGLEALIEELEEHYVPLNNEVSSRQPHTHTHTHTQFCVSGVGSIVSI